MPEPAEYGLTMADVGLLKRVVEQVRSGNLGPNLNGGRDRTARPRDAWIGTADTAFAVGPLTAPNNVVTTLTLPTDDPDSEEIGTVEPDYCIRAVEAGQHVSVTRVNGGAKLVAPLFCDDDEPA